MKKFISILLCGILVLSTGVSALGAETGTGAEASGEEAVRLSLEQAVEIMQTQGSRAETAEINKNADQAVAKGYSESSRSISEQMDELSLYISAAPGSATSIVSSAQAAGLTKTNQKLVQMQRDFAAAHVEDNYQAEMNQIRADTAEFYYGLLQARENLRVCQENLQVQKDILANIERKYELGVAARIAVQTAETAVKQAEQTLAEAETAEASASMNFNMLLGYSLDREVVLTDALEKLPFPELTVEEAVAAALENRLEMEAAAYAAEVQKIQLNSLEVRYPKNSATYMKQQVAYLEAAKAERDAPIQIEMSIRILYMSLEDKASAVDVAQAVLANAQEGYRIAVITFDAGMNTATDVQEAQIAAFQANQGVLAAMTEYALAVYDFEHAMDVGTTRLPL